MQFKIVEPEKEEQSRKEPLVISQSDAKETSCFLSPRGFDSPTSSVLKQNEQFYADAISKKRQ